MVEQDNMNLLFFFGVLIPALVTIALFVVFCYCWYKMRIRNQILYKKHDPHKIERLREQGKNYEAPPPPPPPFKSGLVLLSDFMANNNNNKNKNSDNYEESPEPTEGFDNQAMYRTNPDSGFSDLNQVQCNVENSVQVQRNESDRPNSQASDESDDSGFRSSRSGQYIHSASSSTGNAQESGGQGGSGGVHSLQVSDAVPLFKPIKIHPNDGRPPTVSYVNRNSSKYKSRPRKPLPPSQHYSIGQSESQNMNNIHVISTSQQLPMDFLPNTHFRQTLGQSYNSHPYISKSIGDVHGGRLHSTDSHVGPVTCAGNYGFNLCSTGCSAGCSSRDISHSHMERPFNQLDSIGYASDIHSFGPVHSIGYIGPVTDKGQIKQEHLCYQLPSSNQLPINSHIPLGSQLPGYSITSTSHMRPINPDNGLYGIRTQMSSLPETSQALTITQAMVHKPYIEELSDPTLYSVV